MREAVSKKEEGTGGTPAMSQAAESGHQLPPPCQAQPKTWVPWAQKCRHEVGSGSRPCTPEGGCPQEGRLRWRDWFYRACWPLGDTEGWETASHPPGRHDS